MAVALDPARHFSDAGSMATIFRISTVALAATLFANASTAAENPALAPSEPWRVDYGEEQCVLLRTFGTGADAVTLRLARGSGLQSFDMLVAGINVPRLGANVRVTMTLEPQATEAEFNGYSMRLPNRPESFIRWFDGDPNILAGVAEDQLVRLRADDKFDVAMRWTGGKAALAALQSCHDDLLKGWGVAIDEIRALKVQPEPVGSPGRWVTNDDYPSREMQREIEGTVAFQIKVGTDGSIEDCRILRSSGSAALDEQSCRLVRQRARFKPGRDANDQPTPSYYINRVRWQIPR